MDIRKNPIYRGLVWIFHELTYDAFLHDEFDLKCPVCKLNNPSDYTKCAHCNYDFTELETEERAKIVRKRYYKNLTSGIIIFTILLLVFVYLYNKYL